MKLFGQDLLVIQNQLLALIWNIINWGLQFIPSFIYSKIKQKPKTSKVCISITGPGGFDQLNYMDLPSDCIATVGYNIEGLKSPFITTKMSEKFIYKSDHVIIKTSYFSINYADVTIRWGLYESALRYVGWPIVPGFDFSGEVIWAGSDSGFKEGDNVFGFTLFGAYSSRILVPARQIRLVPKNITLDIAASIPAVTGTAIHAISIAGGWPQKKILTNNKAVLIYSAAGGVGSMLIQISKLCGYSPIVAVVGSSHKVSLCYELGADIVIDKSKFKDGNIWSEVKKSSPKGYIAIFDATGIETLSHSYNNLTQCGRLITYGFHSNLPKASDLLSPLSWIKMIGGMLSMPKFDAMAMVVDSKAVMGFNLSFFAEEHELIEAYMNQVVEWISSGAIKVAEVTTYPMSDIKKAHELIQSGQSRGKIVVKCEN